MTTPTDDAARTLAGSHLVVEEDCWYSCPASGQCYRDDAGTQCDCGYERRVEAIAAALREAEARVWERVILHCQELTAIRCPAHKEWPLHKARLDLIIELETWCRAQAEAVRKDRT